MRRGVDADAALKGWEAFTRIRPENPCNPDPDGRTAIVRADTYYVSPVMRQYDSMENVARFFGCAVRKRKRCSQTNTDTPVNKLLSTNEARMTANNNASRS